MVGSPVSTRWTPEEWEKLVEDVWNDAQNPWANGSDALCKKYRLPVSLYHRIRMRCRRSRPTNVKIPSDFELAQEELQSDVDNLCNSTRELHAISCGLQEEIEYMTYAIKREGDKRKEELRELRERYEKLLADAVTLSRTNK